jgi:hypothetical protein
MQPVVISAVGSSSSAGNKADPKRVPVADVFKEINNLALSTSNAAVWTPASGYAAKVLNLVISVDAAVALEIQHGTTWLYTTGVLSAGHTYVFDFGFGRDGAKDAVINIKTKSGTANAYGTISGNEL